MTWPAEHYPSTATWAPSDILLHRIWEVWQQTPKLVSIFGKDGIGRMRAFAWSDVRAAPRLDVVTYQELIEFRATVEHNQVQLYAVVTCPKVDTLIVASGEATHASVLHDVRKPLLDNVLLTTEVVRAGVRGQEQIVKRMTVGTESRVPRDVLGNADVEIFVIPINAVMELDADSHVILNLELGG